MNDGSIFTYVNMKGQTMEKQKTVATSGNELEWNLGNGRPQRVALPVRQGAWGEYIRLNIEATDTPDAYCGIAEIEREGQR